jgi:hypothetical protein
MNAAIPPTSATTRPPAPNQRIRSLRPAAPLAGTVVLPHALQNLAFAGSAAPHRAHCCPPPAMAAPQLRQNFPEAWAPQEGQTVVLTEIPW